MRDYFHNTSPTRFLFPIDGDCLNANDGAASDANVLFTASIHAATGAQITVNGAPATEQNGVYTVQLLVSLGKNTLTAQNLTDGTSDTVTVFVLPNAIGRYRISSDDNILFLADITANEDVYTSIFDNPYLAVYKKAHDLYGAKVHLNLFYAFDRQSATCFSTPRPNFDLSMVTEKFKAEWEANADWLTLSPHAYVEYPQKPYQSTPPEVILRDFEAIRREVYRFAGEKTFSADVTTVHWGATTHASTRALRDLGYKVLAGYFEINKAGETVVSYHLPAPLAEHVGARDFWYDTEDDLLYGRIDRVLNIGSAEAVATDLHRIADDPQRNGFISIMIHEQYFYPDYRNYLPDFEARVLESARFLAARGYTGCFMKEML